MAECIRVIKTTTIQAQNYHNTDSTQKIHLTPCDLQLLQTEPMEIGFVFHNEKYTPTQIQHLKHSLSTTLSFFPPLSGRLNITEHQDNTVSCSILCNNEGALFVHAAAHKTTVADILKPNYIPSNIVHSLFAFNCVKKKNYQGMSEPLLAVQVTELVDGVFIGCSVNHIVADGTSLSHFINSWAEISRGCEKPSKPPSPKRFFPIRFPFTRDAECFKKPSPQPERVFCFTKEKIAQIKSKANAEANTDKISSIEALLTHVWRTVTVIRTNRRQELPCLLQINARPRMVPLLPESYFGAAVMFGEDTIKVGEVVNKGGVWNCAREMNKMMISLHNEEKIRSEYECNLSSSPRFNFYGYDFGWGKPFAVRTGAANKRCGKVTVFDGAEKGSIEIHVCLPFEILEAMANDPEFMDGNVKFPSKL